MLMRVRGERRGKLIICLGRRPCGVISNVTTNYIQAVILTMVYILVSSCRVTTETEQSTIHMYSSSMVGSTHVG